MDERPSGAVTFLATDIEGSTRLWQRHHEAMKAAIADHDRLVRTAIESHGGYVFSTAGDSFWAAFANPIDAALAALDTQEALAAHDWGEVGHLRVRASIDTGLADERGGDYFGPPLNRASRIMKHAKGGEILCSSTTADLLKHELPIGYAVAKVGRRRLRDVEHTEVLYRISTDSDAARIVHRVLPVAAVAALAVIGVIWLAVDRNGQTEETSTSSEPVAPPAAPAPQSPVSWTANVGPVEVPPVVSAGVVVVAVEGAEGGLVALDLVTGSVVWRRTDIDRVRQLAAEGGLVYVTSSTRFDALDPADGSQIPRCGFRLPSAQARTVLGSDAVYIGSPLTLYKVDSHPGSERCHGPRIERFLENTGDLTAPAVAGAGDHILIGHNRGLYLFDKAGLSEVWAPPAGQQIVEVRPDGIDLVAVEIETQRDMRVQPVALSVDGDGVLRLFHPTADPAEIDLPLVIVAEGWTPLATEDAIIIQRSDGQTAALDPLTGEAIWAEQLGASSLETDGRLLYVGTQDSVAAYRTRTGSIEWSVTNLPPVDIMTVSDSLIVIVSATDQTVSVFDRPGGKANEPPPPARSLDPEEPETVARQFLDAWTRGDAGTIANLLGVHASLQIGWGQSREGVSMWSEVSERDFWTAFDRQAFVGIAWTVADCSAIADDFPEPLVQRVRCEVEVTDPIFAAAGNPPVAFTAILDIDNGVVSFFGDVDRGSRAYEWGRGERGDAFEQFWEWLSGTYPDEFQAGCVPDSLGTSCRELYLAKIDEWAEALDR